MGGWDVFCIERHFSGAGCVEDELGCGRVVRGTSFDGNELCGGRVVRGTSCVGDEL